MIDRSTKVLTTLSRRMLDRLAQRLYASPTNDTAEQVLHSFTKPWAEVFAYTRLATLADGMVDGWDQLPFDLDEQEQESVILQAQQVRESGNGDLTYLLQEFDPQEQLLVRPWFGLPPPEPPDELVISGDGDELFDVRLPTYDWALKQLAKRHLVTREEWDQLENDELTQAFTVAGLETDAALAKVRDALGTTLQQGKTLEEFKDEAGRGSFLSEAHAETVFRTNLHQMYSDGKMALLDQPLVSDAFPYATIDPIGDDRVRKSHRLLETSGMNGTNVYRVDDPVFITFRPPWSWNCRCGWGPITIRQAAAKGVLEAQLWRLNDAPPANPEYVPWPQYNGKPLMPDPAFRRSA